MTEFDRRRDNDFPTTETEPTYREDETEWGLAGMARNLTNNTPRPRYEAYREDRGDNDLIILDWEHITAWISSDTSGRQYLNAGDLR